MIELRWYRFSHTSHELQYRVLMPSIDASGALCPGSGYGPWIAVPETDRRGEEDAILAAKEPKP